MSVEAKCLLIGTVLPAQAEAVLRNAGYETEVFSSDENMTRIAVNQAQDGDGATQILHVFSKAVSADSHEYVYAGERTSCLIGATRDGPSIVALLAREFGGYHLPNDGNEDSAEDWTFEKGENRMELSHSDALKLALQRALPTALTSEAFAELESDEERLVALRDAISTYLEATSATPGPAR